MTNVYVVVCSWQRDCGECGTDVIGVYSSFERAKLAMENEMKMARSYFEDLETEESEYVDGDMSWSIWEEGEYCYNHDDILIIEKEVEEDE